MQVPWEPAKESQKTPLTLGSRKGHIDPRVVNERNIRVRGQQGGGSSVALQRDKRAPHEYFLTTQTTCMSYNISVMAAQFFVVYI